MRQMILILFLFITFLGPLWVLCSGQIDLHADYRTANRDSAHISPDPKTTPEAIIEIYSARAFHWDGLFAVHTWIAVKNPNATEYTVYQVIGWRALRGLAPLWIHNDIPDRNWFGHAPMLLADIRGKEAEELIPLIDQVARAYPYFNNYSTWPGPNSNTFTAYVLRHIPALHVTMPANAIGKDYFGGASFFAPAVSHTGYQVSLWGVLGLTLAKQEGLEINFLGATYGINPFNLSIKLPGFGELSLRHLSASSNQNQSPLS